MDLVSSPTTRVVVTIEHTAKVCGVGSTLKICHKLPCGANVCTAVGRSSQDTGGVQFASDWQECRGPYCHRHGNWSISHGLSP